MNTDLPAHLIPTTWSSVQLERNFNEFCYKLPSDKKLDGSHYFTYEEIISPLDGNSISRWLLDLVLPPLNSDVLFAHLMGEQVKVPDETRELIKLRADRSSLIVQIFHHERYGSYVPMTAKQYYEHLERIVMVA